MSQRYKDVLHSLLHFSIIISQLSPSLSSLIPDINNSDNSPDANPYDPHTRPSTGGVADVINVSLDNLSVREVNEDLQQLSVEFLLHTFWDDKRLANLVERETIFGETNKYWIPNLSIANGVETPNRSGKVLSLKPGGTVDYSERISAKISCHLSTLRYPFGTQHCSIQLVSHGHSSLHLLLLWNGILPLDTIHTFDPEYVVTDIEQSSERGKASDGKSSYHILNLGLSLRRSSFRLIVTALVPTFLLAALSYFVTFFMGLRNSGKIQSGESSQLEKTTLEEEEPESHSRAVKQDEEFQMPDKQLNRDPSFSKQVAVGLIKVAVNGFILLIVVGVKQINFLHSPRSSTLSALDGWMGFMSLTIFICFVTQLQICFKRWKSREDSGDNYVEGRVTRIVRISIPVVFIIFLIAFIGFCLS